eukprot:TRINITY_DN1697_c0_g2_i1.p2 TRINITY_DN1697_c0_g2~~TRINITY_DN1697_c0_g2_i1.p2  ORF type:complete len:131 (+),score=10.54 TRINITY_DN1697_c0_g2_i1:219-611(+)
MTLILEEASELIMSSEVDCFVPETVIFVVNREAVSCGGLVEKGVMILMTKEMLFESEEAEVLNRLSGDFVFRCKPLDSGTEFAVQLMNFQERTLLCATAGANWFSVGIVIRIVEFIGYWLSGVQLIVRLL